MRTLFLTTCILLTSCSAEQFNASDVPGTYVFASRGDDRDDNAEKSGGVVLLKPDGEYELKNVSGVVLGSDDKLISAKGRWRVSPTRGKVGLPIFGYQWILEISDRNSMGSWRPFYYSKYHDIRSVTFFTDYEAGKWVQYSSKNDLNEK